MYFWLADRFCEGPDVLELAVAAASHVRASAASRIEMLLALSYAGPEDDGAQRAAPRVQGTVALGIAVSGDDEHAATLAEDERVRLEELEGHWAAGLRARFDAGTAGGGTAAATAETLPKAEAIAEDAFQVAGLLLDAWIAERRDEYARAVADYREALDVARRTSSAHEPAPVAARTVRALWTSQDARAELARARRALGGSESARGLYRRLVDWSSAPRLQQPRETFLAALAESPAGAALSSAAETAS
ncbi:MAG: hypothetical protein ACXVYM_02575 [Gaiellaceae bacterium]